MPLFPATKVGLGASCHLEALGLADHGWKGAATIRAIFKEAFTAVGLPYFNPHTLRNSLMELAYSLNLSHEEMKAWSQNLGHENVMTSLRNYGNVTTARQSELISGLRAKTADNANDGPSTEWLLEQLKRRIG
ncbi:hypothetical protein [Asticcacaulis sp. YBE204]|uniref:hypothetical protein n=1 Tax=Asticcacaulis sp. YBE204 TaxID=1282363 RepID=UPI0003C3E2AE|nr:hypothetical protein [Asticcacaulis sp. YBE204]ESQ81193.1 hypothetical protein AEYBE204_02335 [Asticcacaulis sp. YBE204]